MAQTYGMAIIPWSPLAGGLLTGKYKRGEEPPEGARFADQSNPHLPRGASTTASTTSIEGLQPIARGEGRARCRSSRWPGCMQQPGVTSPIIGPRTMEQFEDNLKALRRRRSPRTTCEPINRVIRRGDSVAPFYEADFGPHKYR